MGDRMKRVSKAHPCPVCGKSDWCLRAADDSAAICARIERGSIRKCGQAGCLHILVDRHNGHDRHRCGVRWRHTMIVSPDKDASGSDFGRLSVQYQSQLTGRAFEALARSLALSHRGLLRLRVGWDGRAYAFPMLDASGNVVGIRRRFPDGKKASVRGSKNGLFIPADLSHHGPLLICEGPTDTVAALDLGFDAIGRPNCNSLVEMTAQVAKGRTEIVIVADRDTVGIAGATRLANTIALHCPSVKMVQPPDGIKDLRQWLNQGLTPQAFQNIVTTLAPIRVRVSFSRKGVRL